MPNVLVTGGNTGIGLALCTQLVLEHGCRVFLGSRSLEKGASAVQSIVEQGPSGIADRIEVVQCDIGSSDSVSAAARTIKARLGDEKLYAIVNNAGCGLAHGVTEEDMFNTNLYGTKRAVDAFLPLLDADEGRIVSVGSGAGPMYLKSQSDAAKVALTTPGTTWEELDAFMKAERASKDFKGWPAYGLSKAALAAYSMSLAAAHPNVLSMTITPGFIETALTAGMGARKKPEEGTVSIRRCLFEDKSKLVNGAYYGSDGLRSPLTRGRDPGTPEFTGSEGYA